jgi:hypothetical protein
LVVVFLAAGAFFAAVFVAAVFVVVCFAATLVAFLAGAVLLAAVFLAAEVFVAEVAFVVAFLADGALLVDLLVFAGAAFVAVDFFDAAFEGVALLVAFLAGPRVAPPRPRRGAPASFKTPCTKPYERPASSAIFRMLSPAAYRFAKFEASVLRCAPVIREPLARVVTAMVASILECLRARTPDDRTYSNDRLVKIIWQPLIEKTSVDDKIIRRADDQPVRSGRRDRAGVIGPA